MVYRPTQTRGETDMFSVVPHVGSEAHTRNTQGTSSSKGSRGSKGSTRSNGSRGGLVKVLQKAVKGKPRNPQSKQLYEEREIREDSENRSRRNGPPDTSSRSARDPHKSRGHSDRPTRPPLSSRSRAVDERDDTADERSGWPEHRPEHRSEDHSSPWGRSDRSEWPRGNPSSLRAIDEREDDAEMMWSNREEHESEGRSRPRDHSRGVHDRPSKSYNPYSSAAIGGREADASAGRTPLSTRSARTASSARSARSAKSARSKRSMKSSPAKPLFNEAIENRERVVARTIHDVSDEYTCPLSRELMVDPVVAEDGHFYERSEIENYIRHKGSRELTSPITNEPMGPSLKKAVAVQHTIEKLIRSGAISIHKSKMWQEKIEKQRMVVDLMRERASAGNGNAMYNLGVWYQFGRFGFEKDLNAAYHWYMKSAELNDPCGLANAGVCLIWGLGVESNLMFGMHLLSTAASEKSDFAAKTLGDIFSEGMLGMNKDIERGAYWYQKALDADTKYRQLTPKELENIAEKVRKMNRNIPRTATSKPITRPSAPSPFPEEQMDTMDTGKYMKDEWATQDKGNGPSESQNCCLGCFMG